MNLPGAILFWGLYAGLLAAARGRRVFWPLLALGLLLLFNQVFTPGFFDTEIRGGHLYGTRIDILNHGAKVMLLALGMTLVIATGGVDLSVGAVMAVAGAVAAQVVVAHGQPAVVAILAALGVSMVLGGMERPAGGRPGHPAHRGHAHPHGGGTRRRAADHRGTDHQL